MQSQASTILFGTDTPSALGLLKRTAALLVTLILLLEGGYFLLTGLLEIINFGWRQPMFDQYKMYPHYLEFAFPENLIQLENGHRPILPILITLAEIHWLDANQTLHIAVGAFCAFMMAAIPGWAAWRQHSVFMPMRAAAVAIAAVGIFWLANARMLLHGNELLHVYLPGMLVLLAALCAQRASIESPVRWMAAATLLCAGAMFCFGAGVAAFPAIALVAWLSRVPLRAIAVLLGGLLLFLIVYLWVLPGDDGVRQMLNLRPIESIATSARWLGSPWVNAWLGFADPPLYTWMASDAHTGLAGTLLSASSNGIQQMLEVELRRTGSLVFGLVGLLALAIVLARRFLRRRPVSAIENIALTMALFGAAISVLIGVGRLDYLIQRPDQIFANRYLPWSCTFWIGISILAVQRLARARLLIGATTIVLAIAVPWLLLPSHNNWAGWGEAVYKNSQASAAAALSGVFDARMFPNNDSASHKDVVHTLDLLRNKRLAMFAGPESSLLGKQVSVKPPERNVAIVPLGMLTMQDEFSKEPAAAFDVLVQREIGWLNKQGPVVVLDAEGMIRGFALPSFVNGKNSGPRIKFPRKRGYSGYIGNYQITEEYRLAVLDPGTLVASILITLQPPY